MPPAAAEPPPMEEVIPEEETFRHFAEQVWLPLKVVAGGLRPSTIAMYGFIIWVSGYVQEMAVSQQKGLLL